MWTFASITKAMTESFIPSKKGLTISVDLFPELEIGFQKLKEALDEQ